MEPTENIILVFIMNILFLTHQTYCQTVTAEISYGELIDKITILNIKSQRIINEEKLKNVRTEFASLQDTCNRYIGSREDIAQLQALLQKINEELWDIEDAIRVKERKQEFDAEFIAIARSVYITNDRRCAVKKQIDVLLGSHLTEEKSYEKLTCN
ncbi:MAG TPA: DUF6165 family protein [Candidatus Babeliales bacterium]|nr:DUF6165 family protein [Candidatus Babeliales bacterium]